MTVDEYQQQYNKTYVIFYPLLTYQDANNNIYNTFPLQIVQCTDPSLKKFKCLDFSNVSNYTLMQDTSNNINIISQIYLNMYRGLDLNFQKTTVPNNCADQTEKDDVINGNEAFVFLKLKSEQYNTTSKFIQKNYRTIYNYVYTQIFFTSTINTQQQESYVNQGLVFQSQEKYTSPISYSWSTQSFNRQLDPTTGAGLSALITVTIQMDQVVQYFFYLVSNIY
ncbi:hypothetical protein ABPG72_013686 [Tetrahymena utriculariae]